MASQGRGGTVRPCPWDTQQCLCPGDVWDVPALVLALALSPRGASLLTQGQHRHSSQQAPPVPCRSSVFGEKVETVMMQRLNDKGQSVAPPPREVSRAAKSTWTGTRVCPGVCGDRGCPALQLCGVNGK